MYLIAEKDYTLRLTSSKKYERISGLLLLLISVFLGSWPVDYQLHCENKVSIFSGSCTLESKVLGVISRSTYLGNITDADVVVASYSTLPQTNYQIVLRLESGRIYLLQLYTRSKENATVIVSNINHYLHYETDRAYHIVNPLNNTFMHLLTGLLFMLGLGILFIPNRVIFFDKSRDLVLIKQGMFSNHKKYRLSTINRAIIQTHIIQMTPDLKKNHTLALELHDHQVILLPDFSSEVKFELINMLECLNKFLGVTK